MLKLLYGVFVMTTKSATLYVLLFIDIFGKLVFGCGRYRFICIASRYRSLFYRTCAIRV